MWKSLLTLLREEGLDLWKDLERFLENAPYGIAIIDAGGRIIFWNQAAEELLGYRREDVLGKPCFVLEGTLCRGAEGSEEGRPCWVIEGGEMPYREREHRRPSGRVVRVLQSGKTFHDAAGNPLFTVEYFVDLHRLEQTTGTMRAELHRALSLFRPRNRLIGETPQMEAVLERIELAGKSDANVLLTGESGTGKELAAETIVSLSARRSQPFLIASCGALPENLIESELFGHCKGAYAAALRDRQGRLEAAHGGTLFIAEVADLTMNLQVKLLHFLRTGELQRMGDDRIRRADVRLICATRHDLEALREQRRFDEELFYRINVFSIHLPPLRERVDDIPLIAEHCRARAARRTGKDVRAISPEAMDILMRHSWPGNVRELENAIEHAFVMVKGDTILPEHLPPALLEGPAAADWKAQTQGRKRRRGEIDREQIIAALQRYCWHRERAAKALGVSRVTLWKWMRELGITPK
jgi:PAS domain S-box-containing protein